MPDPAHTPHETHLYHAQNHWAVTQAWRILRTLPEGLLDLPQQVCLADGILAALVQAKQEGIREARHDSA